jgi:predicted transcriptional regulator
MRVIWAHGPMTAEAVRHALPRTYKESTVRTLLARIEAKGYLTHDVDGRAFVYRPTEPAHTVAAKGMRRLARWLYGGSVSELLVGLVDARAIDPDDLREAAALLSRARRAGG